MTRDEDFAMFLSVLALCMAVASLTHAIDTKRQPLKCANGTDYAMAATGDHGVHTCK